MKHEILFSQDMIFANGTFTVLVSAETPFVPAIGTTCNLSPQMIGKVERVSHFQKKDEELDRWETYVFLTPSDTFKEKEFSEQFLNDRPEFKEVEFVSGVGASVGFSKDEGFYVNKNY